MVAKNEEPTQAEKDAQERVDKAAYINDQLAVRLAPHDFGLRPAPDARTGYSPAEKPAAKKKAADE